jgi:hypothetical protein
MDLECGGSVRNPGAGSTAKPGIINGLSMAFDPRSLQRVSILRETNFFHFLQSVT